MQVINALDSDHPMDQAHGVFVVETLVSGTPQEVSQEVVRPVLDRSSAVTRTPDPDTPNTVTPHQSLLFSRVC